MLAWNSGAYQILKHLMLSSYLFCFSDFGFVTWVTFECIVCIEDNFFFLWSSESVVCAKRFSTDDRISHTEPQRPFVSSSFVTRPMPRARYGLRHGPFFLNANRTQVDALHTQTRKARTCVPQLHPKNDCWLWLLCRE